MNNYHSNIPNSNPIVKDDYVQIKQNGELGSHPQQPAYYSNVIPSNQLSLLTFDCYDIENDAQISPYLYNTSTNDTNVVNTILQEIPLCMIQLLKYPDKGTLYHLNGTIIANTTAITSFLIGNEEVEGVNQYALRYRPVLNQYSHR